MGSFSVSITPDAMWILACLFPEYQQRIARRIDRLAQAAPAGRRLKGEHAGLWRLDVGTEKLIYELYESEILILTVRVGDVEHILPAELHPPRPTASSAGTSLSAGGPDW